MDVSSMVVAVAGVFGTLGAALLTQRGSERGRRREIEILRQQDDARNELELRRTCYVEVNRNARMFNTALNHHLFVMRERIADDSDRIILDEAKAAHRDSYSQLHLVAPDSVLSLATAANHALNSAYAQIKRLERGTSDPEETIDSASLAQFENWEKLRLMRQAMREDLGMQSTGR